MKQAVFVDRDGTIIEEKTYLHRVDHVRIFPGAIPALHQLQSNGFELFLVTNQSGIGRGYFSMADVQSVHDHLAAELRRGKVGFRKIYVAPEAPDQPSRGRKPSPAFLFDARDEFDLDLSRSFMIGDKLIDLQCGWNAGVAKSILVRTGYGAQLEEQSPIELANAVVVSDLAEASSWILKSTNRFSP